ncbi:hypothetical protein [Paracoccus beibuensis]|uniref:hypothetical protein n=1 Tax=Paracoccus beibuensis TaxID=547602 RepID=UPI00223FEBB0|nr:hypothetical protein [Paracoccus beibuensis]
MSRLLQGSFAAKAGRAGIPCCGSQAHRTGLRLWLGLAQRGHDRLPEGFGGRYESIRHLEALRLLEELHASLIGTSAILLIKHYADGAFVGLESDALGEATGRRYDRRRDAS